MIPEKSFKPYLSVQNKNNMFRIQGSFISGAKYSIQFFLIFETTGLDIQKKYKFSNILY